MIRKLHNSLLALSATTLTLAACLIATGADMGRAELPATPVIAAAVLPAPSQVRVHALDAKVRSGAEAGIATRVPGYRKGKSRRNRQILAMPFFSFATRS